MSSRYILYTVGNKGDNIFLGKCFAEQEVQRRSVLGSKDLTLYTLEYFPSYDGKKDVIQVSYLKKVRVCNQIKNDYMIICYTIQDGECYSCGIFTKGGYNANNLEWIKFPKKGELVKKWLLEFEQMYPRLKKDNEQINLSDNKNIDAIFKLKQEAREWVDFILKVQKFKTLEAGITAFALKQPFSSLVRLAYANNCYLEGRIEEGDKYFTRVYLIKDSDLIIAEEFANILKVRNAIVGERGQRVFLPREGINTKVKPIIQKDVQYYEDLIYELRKRAELDFIFNKETEARIAERCGDLEMMYSDEEEITEFEKEIIMISMKIMEKATGTVKGHNISSYPEIVKQEILRLEAEIELLRAKEMTSRLELRKN